MPQEPAFFEMFYNEKLHIYKQWTENIAADPGGVYPWPGGAVISESLLPDAYPISKKGEALAVSPFHYSEVPTDIHPMVLMGPYSMLTSEPIPEGTPELSHSPLAVVPTQGDFTESWTRDFGADGVVAQGSCYPSDSFQGSWESHFRLSCSPAMKSDICGRSPSPTVQDMGVLMEGVDVKPETYGHWSHSSNLSIRPVHKRHRCEHSAHRTGQVTCDRRFTCTVDGCRKDFSGKWEMDRHIKSVHRPPTIGCRECNYKQSRKDLFSEHCKKRHPDGSIAELMLPLDTPSA
ncbi:hypothetical protein BJV78DRAFT_1151659 [Lactifluus subvellereus]|nr:hypothetical protein BJV78DRAFT_1151659 [Lactifluus subvellereus]